jgi:hAT family C-terminal dimerisation region
MINQVLEYKNALSRYANDTIMQVPDLENSELYPTLAKIARDFLVVPVSIVASESAFSAAC